MALMMMNFLPVFTLFTTLVLALPQPAPLELGLEPRWGRGGGWHKEKVTPKVMIISMFAPERAVWEQPLSLTVHNYTLPGLSPLFPHIGCNEQNSICIMTTGEGEINAAATSMAMLLSNVFDFSLSYFLIAGIGGVNPYYGTLGTAAFARFAVQVALQYELDPRQMPTGGNWTGSAGYWSFGTKGPGLLPPTSHLYGTEVFELSTPLLARVMDLTKTVKLNDSTGAIAYRKNFDFAPANLPPVVTQCDVATSDNYYAGTLLAESFGNYTSLITNGSAVYCTTAQEDNATLESIVRAHKAGLADYSRVVILRTGSDFDRAPPPSANLTAYEAFEAKQGGFAPALENLYLAGWPVVKEIVYDWQAWVDGTPTQSVNGSYYGDDLGTLRDGAALA